MVGCEKAQELAGQIGALSDKVAETIRNFSDAKWHSTVPHEGRSANVLASHIAVSFDGFSSLLGAVLGGHPLPPLTDEMFDSMALRHEAEHRDVSKTQVLDQLRACGGKFIADVKALSEEDLGKCSMNSMFGRTWPTEGVVQIALSHTGEHLAKLVAFA